MSGYQLCHLSPSLAQLLGLAGQFVLHLVERPHHLLLLQCLCLTFPLFSLQPAHEFHVFFPKLLCLVPPLLHLILIDEHVNDVLDIKVFQWGQVRVHPSLILEDNLLKDSVQELPLLEVATIPLVGHLQAVVQDREQAGIGFRVLQLLVDQLKHLGGTFCVNVDHVKPPG